MLSETGLVLDGTVLGDVHLGGAMLLTEGTPSDICITWRAHQPLGSILVTAILNGSEIRGPQIKLPNTISAIDMCEYLTEIDNGEVEARLALFVVTEDHHLYRFSVAHPGVYGGSWPAAPEPECSYKFTKVPVSSSIIAVTAINAFTGLVAFTCGSIVYATIHPEITADPAQREFDLNPVRAQGLIRSLVLGSHSQRPIPVSVAILPYTVVNGVDRLEHEISVVAVFCSDGYLRLWNVSHTSPFAAYCLSESVSSAKMKVESIGQNTFCVAVYVNNFTSAQFFCCHLDLNPSEPEFELQSQIECLKVPIVDFCITRDRIWAIWTTPEGYSVQHHALLCGSDQSPSAKGWKSVLSQTDAINRSSSIAVDSVQYAESPESLRQMFEYLMFGQPRYHLLVLSHVLCNIHGQPFHTANTYEELQHAILSYIETSVNEALLHENVVDSNAKMMVWFRVWSSFHDDCRIFQEKFQSPIAIVSLSSQTSASARNLLCLKAQGFSQIRGADLSESLLMFENPKESRCNPDSLSQLITVCNRFVAEFASDTDYFAAVDGVFGRPDSVPPSLVDYLKNSIVDAPQLCASLSRIVVEGLGPIAAHLEQTVRRVLDQFLQDEFLPSSALNFASDSSFFPLVSNCVSQILLARYVCIRNLTVCLLFASSQADLQLSATLIHDIKTAFHTLSIIRWISIQHFAMPSDFSAPVVQGKKCRIVDILSALDFIPTALFPDSLSVVKKINRRNLIFIGHILLRARQFTLLHELCCRMSSLSLDSTSHLALLYYRGICCIAFGLCEKAMSYLVATLSTNDDEFIRKHTDFSTFSEYALHLVSTLTKHGRPDLALNLPADEKWIFEANLSLCRFTTAYEMLNSERIRDMVLSICRSGQFHLFRELPWIGFRQEVHSILSEFATKSSITSKPDYFAILYSTLLTHDDRHAAADVMWRCSKAWHSVRPGSRHTLQCECDALSITLHTLRSGDDSDAFVIDYQDAINSSCDQVQGRSEVDTVNSQGSAVSILSVDDIGSLLRLRLAQLKLSEHEPTYVAAGLLSLPETVSALVHCGFMSTAVSIADKSLLPSLFNLFVEKCIALDHGAQNVNIYFENCSVQSLMNVPESSRKEWLRKKAWKELQVSLESVKDLSMYKICAVRILQLDQRRGQLPLWIVSRFRGSFGACETDPVWMARLLLQHHMPSEAARFVLDCLQYQSTIVPTAVIEELINICNQSTDLCHYQKSFELLLQNVQQIQSV